MLDSLLQELKVLAILLAAALILILVDSRGFLNFPKGLIQDVTSPIQYGLYKSSLAVGKQFEFIFLARRAAQENKALTEQLASALSDNAQLRRSLAEAQAEVDQQNTLAPKSFTLIPARPIGISRYLTIDKGSDDGFKVGMPVVYKDNYIGEITSLSSKKSDILLSSDPDSKISAYVADKDGKAQGVLTGQFGSEALMDEILHQEPVQVGDLVYSQGTESNIPRGLVLGSVSRVLGKDTDVFKQAIVKPVFDITNLDLVFVITD